MNQVELIESLNREDIRHKETRQAILNRYASDNARCKRGDIIESRQGIMIKVENIQCANNLHVRYIGTRLRKIDYAPFKRGLRAAIYDWELLTINDRQVCKNKN